MDWPLSLIHISEPTRLLSISYAVFCLKKKKKKYFFFFFLMIRRPPRSTLDRSSAASDVYKRQSRICGCWCMTCCARNGLAPVSYTHLRAHETPEHLVCRLLLEKKKKKIFFFFFFNDTATTEIYTRSLVGSVRCV